MRSTDTETLRRVREREDEGLDLLPCVYGHFDCTYADGAPCFDEARAWCGLEHDPDGSGVDSYLARVYEPEEV